MQTTGDRNKETAASPNSTDQRREGGAAATELGRHYGEHGHPATTSAGPAAQDAAHTGEQARSAAAVGAEAARDVANRARDQAGSLMAKAGETAQDLAGRTGEQARSAMAKAGETARDLTNRAGEQVNSASARASESARDLANRAREQAGPVAQAVYDQGARAGQYVTRNVHEYPATALLVAAAVGYGLAYLLHGASKREFHNRYDQGAH